ncbi:MAG TPA: hypothetical protein PLV85_04195 [Polyangiaceae bacterium]|jgi:hypothetical protein|nr:hypothetical protein [Polyangiaceae bacterium]
MEKTDMGKYERKPFELLRLWGEVRKSSCFEPRSILHIRRVFAVVGGVTLSLVLVPDARANPRPLPFTYPYATLSEDELEIEQYVDATPIRMLDSDGKKQWEPRYKLQTEFEYGLSDRFEFAFYLQYSQKPGGALGLDGTKQRVRFRLAEAGDWPVDVAFYLEVAELRHELEFEQKIILEKDIGQLQLITNLWFEQEIERYSERVYPILNPTFGASYALTPVFRLGAEYWMHAKLGKDGFNADPHHFVGPAFAFIWGKLWWSTAAYARLDGMKRAVQPDDKYGHVWIRSVVGLQL